MIRRLLALLGCVLLVIACAAANGHDTELPAKTTAPGELRTHGTIHSIGIEWDLSGDANHNAECQVRFRAEGTTTWKKTLPLFRIDYFGVYNTRKADRAYNMFAGSILFLQPGTRYEVELDLRDPDGGAAMKRFTIATRPLPRLPEGGKKLYVTPGDGGGDGTAEKPFLGLASAQKVVQPGDVVLMRPGKYGVFKFDKPGESGRFIAWKKAEEGEVVFDSAKIAASHLYLEGLTFRKNQAGTALKVEGAVKDVALCRSSFFGFHHSIMLSRESADWYIADNVIVGDNDPEKSILEGEAIDLNASAGHVVAHNRVSRTENGVHYPGRNCDIFGNDIFDTTDDGIEPDYGYCNIRIWENRIYNYKNNGLSFQPMFCGPWYFIRNQVIGTGYTFKFRVQDRFLLVNNTFVTWSFASPRMHHVLTSYSRNNLYICAGKPERAPIWTAFNNKDEKLEMVRAVDFKPNWMTDVDYDGFDWGESKIAFRWDKKFYNDLPSFAADIGIEKHGVRVFKEQIFERFDVPREAGRVGPTVLTLKKGSNAVDAGAVVPNINEEFVGRAPDLGAHELGRPAPTYGPRTGK